MDVRVGLWRKLSTKELMLLNCGVEEDSVSPLDCKEVQPVYPKGDQSWVFILATWCKELSHWKRSWCWEGLEAGGEGNDRRWDGWMALPTLWTWVWVNSRSLWWTGRPGVVRFMGSQRVGHDWATELNWTEPKLAGSARSTRLAGSTEKIADKGNELSKVPQQASGSAGARINLIP